MSSQPASSETCTWRAFDQNAITIVFIVFAAHSFLLAFNVQPVLGERLKIGKEILYAYSPRLYREEGRTTKADWDVDWERDPKQFRKALRVIAMIKSLYRVTLKGVNFSLNRKTKRDTQQRREPVLQSLYDPDGPALFATSRMM